MKHRILYVEDNDQNFYLVSYMLSAKGYEVTRAVDGRTGIELAVREAYDLILLDIQLPDMTGHEVARTLRRCPGREKVPVVALTSYAMAGDREKALAAGCTGYVEKPLDPVNFGSQIETFLRGGDE